MGTFHDDFDYENAKQDIWENGGDPDYLPHRDPAERDAFLKDMGLNPKDYGSEWEDSELSGNSSGFWDELDDLDDENYDDIDPDEYYAEEYQEYDNYDSLKGGITYKKPQPQPQPSSPEAQVEADPEDSDKISKTASLLAFCFVVVPILIGIAVLLFSCAKIGIQDKAPGFVVAAVIGAVITGLAARYVIKDLLKKK